ncbi:PH domain-containing protein [Actinotalea fermentans]|uniref:PH domain-containing protein n=1 Tax=Actinotalea fermentans TaxID=43671 RepID=UPI001649D7F5|nr:PH domain-containing protein [Actinotalea fermentans]
MSEAPVPSAPVAPADGDPRVWRRFHPVTPVVKGWKVLLVLLVVLGQQAGDNLSGTWEVLSSVGWWAVGAVPLAVLLLATGYAAIAWRMSRYAVDETAVFLHTGVLFRQQRTARLDRIQAIDVVQPLLGRVFGLAELKIEVAGGADSAVRLAFLREQHAQELRAELLARAAGLRIGPSGAGAALAGSPVPAAGAGAPHVLPVEPVDAAAGVPPVPPPPGASAAGPGGPAPTAGPGLGIPVAPEREIVHVTPGRLLASLVRSGSVLVSVLALVGLAVAAIATGEPGGLVAMLPAALGAGGYVWQRFAGEFGFRVAMSPDGIRLRHGLLEARAQTVPPGRVQAVRLTQGLLWRGKDWWRVQMNVAGYGTGSSENGGRQVESVLLPVGDRQEALLALWLVLPDLGVEGDPRPLLDAALAGSGEGHGFVTPPRQARWLDPLTWRRHGVALTGRAVLVRGGWLVRTLTVVPHERTQSLGVEQGPLQRRLGIASVHLHSTPGPVVPVVPHLDAHVAGRLLDDQAARARAARATAVPERWMARGATPA